MSSEDADELGFVMDTKYILQNFLKADVHEHDQKHLMFATDTLSFLIPPVFGIPP